MYEVITNNYSRTRVEMNPSIPKNMKAAVIDRFGGPEALHVATIPVPELSEREVLIRVNTAGIGVWDPWMREGGASSRSFPLVLGSDGAGTVAAVGPNVHRFKIDDRIYGYGYDNQKGGFYAEYAAVSENNVALIPANVKSIEAGALAVSGITALRGLEELKLDRGQAIMIVGASGGVGHVALQLAKLMMARVLAVASGTDGVDLVQHLGADRSVDGHDANIVDAVLDFAPEGLDAALTFVNSDDLEKALKQVKKGGSIAYPNGVEPEPEGSAGVKVHSYDGLPSPGAFERLNGLIAKGSFRVHVSRTYQLDEAAQAHRDILKHHIGKLALKIND
jgi:NADPH:quinone reductase